MRQISQINNFQIYDLDIASIVSGQCYPAPGLLCSIFDIARKELSIWGSFSDLFKVKS